MDVGDALPTNLASFHSHGNRRTGAVGDQGGQSGCILMIRMQSGYSPIILHTEQQVSTLGIGQRHDRCNQIPIRQAFLIAFELDLEILSTVKNFFQSTLVHAHVRHFPQFF
jgi:hypothetical protein